MFESLLVHYRQQAWDRAEAELRRLMEGEPECMLYALYLERIEYFRDSPPKPDWDGVFTHETK